MKDESLSDYKIACTQRDKIIQQLDKKIGSQKAEISKLKKERRQFIQDIKRFGKNQLTEEEVEIIYKEYPKLLKEIKEKEKRLDEGKIGELIKFIERNTSSQGYVKSRGLLNKLKGIVK